MKLAAIFQRTLARFGLDADTIATSPYRLAKAVEGFGLPSARR